ncbi:hypothetical protein LC55x_3624 [Lysobacter capsici]|nr:hypothetical protein LC55x_3624 [Lysobacter capsici]
MRYDSSSVKFMIRLSCRNAQIRIEIGRVEAGPVETGDV